MGTMKGRRRAEGSHDVAPIVPARMASEVLVSCESERPQQTVGRRSASTLEEPNAPQLNQHRIPLFDMLFVMLFFVV